MVPVLAVVAAYLVGSIPFAVLVSRAMGLPDPRSFGSGNPGATNVLRSGSKTAAVLTLIGDALKGWAAVWAAGALGLGAATFAAVGVGAFLGHVFSAFLRLRGGKGVATAAGVLFAFDWRVGLGTTAVWVTVAAVTRYSSLAALTAALVAPMVAWLAEAPTPVVAATAVMSAVLIWRHQSNIGKLLRGEEGRLGEKSRAR
jgi:glycerol-3-phosphate acyltransferase PlsY